MSMTEEKYNLDYSKIKTKNPKTNFDKITSSVESLAEFIEKITTTCKFDGCNKVVR